MPDVRLINANALKEWLGCDGDNKYSSMIMHEIADRIDEQPTIDAVAVVRCMGCRKRQDPRECPMCFTEVEDIEGGRMYKFTDLTRPDGFCHMGAKMDGGAGK